MAVRDHTLTGFTKYAPNVDNVHGLVYCRLWGMHKHNPP